MRLTRGPASRRGCNADELQTRGMTGCKVDGYFRRDVLVAIVKIDASLKHIAHDGADILGVVVHAPYARKHERAAAAIPPQKNRPEHLRR